MKAFIELFVKAVVRGIMYAIIFAFVGGVMGLFFRKGFIEGAYTSVLVGSGVAMLVAVYGFIGSPKARFSFFTQNRFDQTSKSTKELNMSKTDEQAKDTFGQAGFYPTIIAVEMLVIGFIIEAMLH